MSTSAAQPAPEEEKQPSFRALAPYADTLSKSVAAIVVALYVAGFLIVSLHHAHFGFTTTEPFRPRILAAGTWFFLLLAIPAVTLVETVRASEDSTGRAQFLVIACAGLNLLAYVLCPIFMDFSNEWDLPHGTPLIILIVSAAVVIALMISKKIPRAVSATLSVITVVVVILVELNVTLEHGFGPNGPAAWFNIILLLGLFRYTTWSVDKRRSIETHDVLLPGFGILLAFSLYIYPHIKASWGGGTPVPATVYFGKESPIKAGQAVSAQVVEESDQGFYLVAPKEKKRCLCRVAP
jgi:hypothetical protein